MGIGLYGAFFMALGCFASSLTRSQIVAAVLTFAVGTGLFILGYLADLRPTEVQWWHHLVQHISMLRHMQDFSTGIVDSRHVMFYVSLTVVFLFFTLKSVESRRWNESTHNRLFGAPPLERLDQSASSLAGGDHAGGGVELLCAPALSKAYLGA